MASKPLCRLCIEEVEPLLDIFGSFGRDQQIREIVLKHFNIDVKEDDLLSDKMCTTCWSKLIDFHTFYYEIQKAQERITMVVIDDDNVNVVHFGESMEHRIISNESSLEDLSIHDFKVDSELNAESIENQTESSREKEYYIDSINKHDSLIQITSQENVPNYVYEPQIEESTMQSSFEASGDESVSIHQKSGTQSEDVISDQSVQKKRKYIKRKSKSKNCNDNAPEFEDTLEESFTPRKRNSRVRRNRQPEPRYNMEEQQQKEIDLIESYYKMQCNLCQEEFEKFQPLFDHYSEMHQLRGFIICCGKKLFRRPTIAEHILWHTYPEQFTCAECASIMPNKRSFDNHMLMHATPDTKLYECDQCSKRFMKKFKFEKHKLSHLKDYEKPFTCDECDKPYATEALLKAHKRAVHQHSYSRICEICARVFKSRLFFEKHQLEHQGQNLPKVQCNICEAWMKNEHTMRAHMRMHQDEGIEHACDICGKKGPSRNAIAKHKRFVHLSERKFKCTMCEKAFKRAITLKEHMTVHTGEVLYTCTFCPKTFNSGANMHAHRKKAHPAEWYEDKQQKLESLRPTDAIG